MPTIDASIYNALLQPRKSAMDYADQYAAQDDRRAARQLNALQLQQAQQGMADERDLRSFMSGAPDLSKPDVQAKLYGLAPKAAGAMLKDRAAMEKEAAQTAQAKASTANSEFELNRKKIDFAWQAVGGAYTPDHARQAIQQGAQLGYFTPEQAQAELQSVPNDPGAYQQWRQQKMLSILPVKDQFEQQWKQREFDLKRNNELVSEDGKVNTTLQGLKLGLAKAGASNISISTGQRGLDNEFKLRGEFKGEPVYKAHQEMQSAYSQIKQAIDQQSPAGDLAAATKIMKLLDPGSVVRESELGMAMQASGLVDRIQNFVPNILSGQKLTPEQRKSFRALADALYSTSVDQFNSKRAEYEKLGGEYGLNAPRALGPNAQAPATASNVQSLVDKYRSK